LPGSISDALLANDATAVRAALQDDPLAAAMFVPGSMQPVVVAAIAGGSSLDVLAALLLNGADADAVGIDGMTALQLVCGVQTARPLMPSRGKDFTAVWALPPSCGMLGQGFAIPEFMGEEKCMDTAAWLLAFDANPVRRGRGGGGRPKPLVAFSAWAASGDEPSCAEAAEARGFWRLAHLLRHWDGKQVAALRSACHSRRSAAPVGVRHSAASLPQMPEAIFENICEMIAPRPPRFLRLAAQLR